MIYRDVTLNESTNKQRININNKHFSTGWDVGTGPHGAMTEDGAPRLNGSKYETSNILLKFLFRTFLGLVTEENNFNTYFKYKYIVLFSKPCCQLILKSIGKGNLDICCIIVMWVNLPIYNIYQRFCNDEQATLIGEKSQ